MDVNAVVREFANSEGLPHETIRSCLSTANEVVPGFLDILERVAENRLITEDEKSAVFLIIHILGELGEKNAYRPLMKILEIDRLTLDEVFGDAITGTIHKIIVNIFDGKTDPLYRVIRNPDADEFARDAAFRAWTYLADRGDIDKDEAERFLADCYESLQPQARHYIWSSWLDALAVLRYDRLMPLAKNAFEKGFPPPSSITPEDFEHLLETSRSAKDRKAFLYDHHLEPFTDTIGSLSEWYEFSDDYLHQKRQDAQAVRMNVTADNPYRNVGRNDPCPCGSGKKFKKCCLN
ncbi:MAG: DUF1186 domain-containing protein [Proteobacteria bacterium]|jgi:uncharacterized protein|nr:DUF1186 domain-containing protein [Pseudomonadota bacterium]